jgi:hypothetical protein
MFQLEASRNFIMQSAFDMWHMVWHVAVLLFFYLYFDDDDDDDDDDEELAPIPIII